MSKQLNAYYKKLRKIRNEKQKSNKEDDKKLEVKLNKILKEITNK